MDPTGNGTEFLLREQKRAGFVRSLKALLRGVMKRVPQWRTKAVTMLCESDLPSTDLSGLEVEHYGCQGRTARRN